MKRQKKKILVATGGAVISAFALGLFVYRLRGHWSAVWAALQGVDAGYVVFALGFLVVLYACRIQRWRLLLRPIRCVAWFTAMSATVIGFTINNLLPARLGELVRPYLICKREDLDYAHALSTVGLARMFDLVGLALLLFIAGVSLGDGNLRGYNDRSREGAGGVVEQSSEERGGVSAEKGMRDVLPDESRGDIFYMVWRGGLLASGAAVLMIAGLLLIALWSGPVLRIARTIICYLPSNWQSPVESFFESVMEALGVLRNWRHTGAGLFWSGGIWICQAMSTWMLARGMGLHIGLGGACLVTLAVAAAVALPQAPGFLGMFHLAAALVVEGFDVSTAEAGAFAMLMWLINIIPVTMVGVGFLVQEGLNVTQLQEESERWNEQNV